MNAEQNPEIGKTVQAAGLATNYLEAGTGAPVLLLHGSGPGVTAYANWRLVIPVLAKNFHVVAPDLPGFGYTERAPNVEYTLDFWVRHIVDFMDALKIPKASFVGNSFGGALTLALTTRHPERVERLTLMGSAGLEFEMTPALEVAWGYTPSLEAMRELMDCFAYDQSLITDELIESRYRASIRPGYQESYAKLFQAPRQRHIHALSTPEAAIAAIDKEALIIHGREDRILPVECSLRLHRLIPRSQLHVFGQCGHWTQVEKRIRFCRLVEDFLLEGLGQP